MSKIRRVDYYPDEFLIGVTGLSAEEIGLYWVVCSLIYSSGGPIPGDDPRIFRCGGTSSRRWPAVRKALVVAGKLHETEDGRLSNRRCEKELGDAQRRVQQAADAGKTGGRPRKATANLVGTPDELPIRDGVQGELAESSGRVHAEFGALASLKNNDLRKGSGFSDEKPTITITTNHHSEETYVSSAAAAAPASLFDNPAPPSPKTLEATVYELGKRVLGKAAGGMVTKLRRHHGGDLEATMRTLQLAESKADPREWIGAILRGDATARGESVLDETDRLYRALGVQ